MSESRVVVPYPWSEYSSRHLTCAFCNNLAEHKFTYFRILVFTETHRGGDYHSVDVCSWHRARAVDLLQLCWALFWGTNE